MGGLFQQGATPRFIPLGANDKSERSPVFGDENYPQHLPKFYIWMAKGRDDDDIIVSNGGEANRLCGDDTFDPTKKFYNHATRYVLGALGAGNKVMLKRLLPEDIGPRANVNVYLDVLPAKIPNYLRDSQGNLVLDNSGAPTIDTVVPEVQGFKLKWVTDFNTREEPEQSGLLVPQEGTMEATVMVEKDHPTETEEVQVGTGTFHTVSRPTGRKINKKQGTGVFEKKMVDTGRTKTVTTVTVDTSNAPLDTIVSPGAYTAQRDTDFEAKVATDQEILINDDTLVSHSALKFEGGEFKVDDKLDLIELKTLPSVNPTDGTPVTLQVPADADKAKIVELLNSVKDAVTTWNGAGGNIKMFGDSGYETESPWKDLKLNITPKLKNDAGQFPYSTLKTSPVWQLLQDVTGKVYPTVTSTTQVPIMEERNVEKTIDVEVDEMADVQEEIMRTETRPKKVLTEEIVKSRMYPILEARAQYPGSYYNNIGFNISSYYGTQFNFQLAKQIHKVPYGLTLFTRPDEKNTTGVVFRSLFGENEVEFVATDEPTKDPSIDARCDLEHVFNTNWYNVTDPLKALRPFDIGTFKFYGNNFRLLLKKFLEAELEGIEFTPRLFTADNEYATTASWYDFDGTSKDDIKDQFELLNPFTCRTSKNVRLQRVMLSQDRPILRDNLKEVNMSSKKPIFLQGGTDGTINDDNFNRAFGIEMDKYDDEDSNVQELAYNIESTLWDSGFPLETKKKIMKFISVRKDTFIVLSTHTENKQIALPLAKARAVGVALATALKLYPESTFYNTGVARGLIVLGAGKLADDSTDVYVPMSYELLIKTARFAGGSDGLWRRDRLFDHGDAAIITSMKDMVPSFLPHGIKPTLWSGNMIYPQRYDRSSFFFPGLQTVYDSDTSVLNNYFTVMALCTVTKIAHKSWKRFSGAISYTDAEFKQAIEAYLERELAGRFAGLLNATPICIITDADKQRGYSWQLVIKLAANMMRTVCVYTTEIYRMGEENI